MAADPYALVAILGMAAVTLVVRLSGIWMVGRGGASPFLARCLRHAPGGLLVAMLAPTIVAGGLATVLAASATLAVASRTGNLAFGMLAGVVVVILAGAVL
jgi:uncharacterized membrane protein